MNVQVTKESTLATLTKRIELGIVGGVVASITMGVVLIIFAGIGLQSLRFFTLLPEMLGMTGTPYELGVLGLILHFIVGVFWGIVYALLFKTYSITKGLGISAFQLLIFALLLTVSPIPGYDVNLINLPVFEAARIIAVNGITMASYGVSLGFLAKHYI